MKKIFTLGEKIWLCATTTFMLSIILYPFELTNKIVLYLTGFYFCAN